jgi:hypothetical protein
MGEPLACPWRGCDGAPGDFLTDGRPCRRLAGLLVLYGSLWGGVGDARSAAPEKPVAAQKNFRGNDRRRQYTIGVEFG